MKEGFDRLATINLKDEQAAETFASVILDNNDIARIREVIGYKEDGSNTSLAIGSVLDSIQHGGNIEEAADVLFQILSTKKDIISTNQELATSEERVAESVDEASSNSEQRLKQLIQNQKEWLEYLDSVLNDENFKSSGKRDATQKLKARTQSLIQQRNGMCIKNHIPTRTIFPIPEIMELLQKVIGMLL